MKEIKKFEMFINETVINPMNYDDLLDIISSTNDIDELNGKAFDFAVNFIGYDIYKKHVGNNMVLPPKRFMLPGIYFTTYNYLDDMTYFVIEPIEFLRVKNSPMHKDFFNKVLRHESIHRQQVYKNRDFGECFDVTDSKKYLTNRREQMAWARTILDELMDRLSIDEIENKLKSYSKLSVFSHSLNHYLSVVKDEKERKSLYKYIYQYIELEKNNEE